MRSGTILWIWLASWLALACGGDGGEPSGLRIGPAPVTLGIGDEVTVTAYLVVDEASQRLGEGVTWEIGDGGVASVTPRADGAATVRGLATGATVVTARARGLSATAEITVGMPVVTAIAITPEAPTVAAGLTVALTATGTFSDGGSADITSLVAWASASPLVAAVDGGGVVMGLAPGTSEITASRDGASAMVTVTVGPRLLQAIAVTPADPVVGIGMTQQMTATGSYSIGPTMDLTAQVTWTTGSATVATVSGGGLVVGVAEGATPVVATLGAVAGQTTVTVPPASLVALAVTPATASIARGHTVAFTATGTFSDSSVVDLTEQVAWSSSASGVATVSTAAGTRGVATGVGDGTATITASSGVVMATATLEVTPAVLEAITVTPGTPTLPRGRVQTFSATGLMSDGAMPDLTATATWASSDEDAVTISGGGVATATEVGTSTISATFDGVSGETLVTVGPAIVDTITVTPADPTRAVGTDVVFTATGTFSDASVGDVTAQATWASSDAGVATVSASGVAAALAEGQTTVSATVGAARGETTLTVATRPVLVAVSPADGASAVPSPGLISVTFSRAMNPATLVGQGIPGTCAGSVQVSTDGFQTCLPLSAPTMSAGETVVTYTPVPALALGTPFRVRVTTTAESVEGVGLAADVTQPTGFTTRVDEPCGSGLVVSQIYGGGGNVGAVYTHDFIELHNTGPTPVQLADMAVQYASATGTSWNVTPLPAVELEPGGYFLVQQAAGAGGTTPLPAPDATGTIAMAASAGKVALTTTVAALSGSCPSGPQIVDLVGFGAAATCFDGAGPTPAPGNTTAVLRRRDGCVDGREDSTDFVVAAPIPRSSTTAAPRICACVASESDRPHEVDYCVLQHPPTISAPVGATLPAIYARLYEAGLTELPGASALVRVEIGLGPVSANPQVESGWLWFPAAFNLQVGSDDEYQLQPSTPAAGDHAYAARASLDGTNWTYCDLDGAGANAGLTFSPVDLGAMTIEP
ncbi:MAG: Ig-like domain-containing protein [Kofleriaceae bacterium]|nr:Ig-like domain-containing protein [Kofleriaceae bacterium]MCL4227481.1 Ig-like domain-containing protein [Myxococcales bacterium]